MALAVVQRCVSQLIDLDRPQTASVTASVEIDTSSIDLTIALSRLAEAMGDARDRPDDTNQGKRLQTLRLAAVAARLAAITRSPDQAPVFAQLLAEIQSPV
ncbi:hypothetical protein [Lysobacter capsici]|uniref:hypothetical protein n=1 Tax=Lysobacter capsici TaxID=435897 RepID=UPI00128C70A2|nr:hypothetical protein [Lysobacter capsici]WND82418.1 hypothetical protein RJ610_08730 [Lysobacter capsici]WND87614.1 hypothetical protein RJ609_08735 [Lysobacter capsici]